MPYFGLNNTCYSNEVCFLFTFLKWLPGKLKLLFCFTYFYYMVYLQSLFSALFLKELRADNLSLCSLSIYFYSTSLLNICDIK